MVVVLLIVSHFMGQVDLTQISFLWLIIAMALNAFQASFSGFCPMFKNAKGECVACGVSCSESNDKPAESTCCPDSSNDCCTDKAKASNGCSDASSDANSETPDNKPTKLKL
jgi:hypothetical protein